MKNREILRSHYSSELAAKVKAQTPKRWNRRFINKFTFIIENNIGNQKYPVDELTQTMGISRVQLYRKVKALLSYNINDYIPDSRLQKAKYFLNNSDLSISENSLQGWL